MENREGKFVIVVESREKGSLVVKSRDSESVVAQSRERGSIIVSDGGLVYFEYELCREKNVQFKIRCQCGGETDLLTMSCHPTDPRFIPLIVGVCGSCQRELSAGVYFYRCEVAEAGERLSYIYACYRNLLVPVQIKCPACSDLSMPVFVHCLSMGVYEAPSICQTCQTPLTTEIEFLHT